MPRLLSRVLTLLGLLPLLLAARPGHAATYHGRDLDGRRYQASILNHDYGKFDNVEVKFDGEDAFVTMHNGGRLVLILQDEEITDPHRILADDPRRGITWEIDLKEQVGRR